MSAQSRIVAVLGPTNTGKTHYAIERMLGYRTGVIGLPLRLLAREVYDRIVAIRGPSVVALVTGEERIVPARTQYWVCTVEAMPEGMGADFLAVDEIQLCADPERGHVFTDRLLRARGTQETVFLGSDTMKGPIRALVPDARFQSRERLSELLYTGSKKITRMPARSAIVGFSVDNVYAIAELLRRQKGGAAVVMGALSPRTRNAQVALYQNGEVDYLVATDAIGMGLNLDINHVAFSAVTKFDGRRMRPLAPNELAQIAGRAGRGMSNGTFGVTGEASALDDAVAQAIMDHRFTPLKKLTWRSSDLRFGSIQALIAALETAPQGEHLTRAREADDLLALKSLSQSAEVMARASDGPSVRLLWDVCRIPDFRSISHAEHASLLETLFGHLHERGTIPDDWLARQIRFIDKTQGDIDTLSKRLAFIRTWTYVAQRSGWTRDENHWRDDTRRVEDALSDALHAALTQRFVDRRTSVLLRRLKQKEALLADVSDNGDVTVEGEFVGRLMGFRFNPDKSASSAEAKAVKSASLQALAPHFHLRADRFYNAPDTEIDFTDQGGLMWGEHAVGKLVPGPEAMKPGIDVFVDDSAGPDVAQKVQRRLQHFLDRKISALFEPLLNLQRDTELPGLARGFAFQMVEALGILPRGQVNQEVKQLDQEARGFLRKHGMRFGQFTIFMPLLLKPAPTRLRLLLWSLSKGLSDFPSAPPPGLVTVPVGDGAPDGYDTMCGYRTAGARMIRIDMLERLADMLRSEDSRGGFEAKADMLSISGLTLEQFADLMGGLGYNGVRGERTKQRSDAPPADAGAGAEAAAPVRDTTSDQAPSETAQESTAAPETVPDSAPDSASESGPPPGDPVPVTGEAAPEAEAPAVSTAPARDAPDAEALSEGGENSPPDAKAKSGDAADDAQVAEPEIEVFYTFTWGRARSAGPQRPPRARKPGARVQGKEPQKGKGRPKGKGKPQGQSHGKPAGSKSFSAKPPRKEKEIDPDNPFAAALMGLKQSD